MSRPERAALRDVLTAFLQDHFRSITGVLLIALMGAAVSLGVQWLQDPYRFPLRVVKVNGDMHYLEKARLQQAVAPFVQGGFFTVDVAAICRAVEALPWVYRVTVQRDWPDRLNVLIEEQQAVARWGEYGLLNRHGESFFPEELPQDIHLPRLSGPQAHEQTVLEQYRGIARLLKPLGLQLARLELDERRAWYLEMDNGVQLELGRADTRSRLQRFVRSWTEVFAGRTQALQRVDLRYSNGFSVYWQPGEEGGANHSKHQRG